MSARRFAALSTSAVTLLEKAELVRNSQDHFPAVSFITPPSLGDEPGTWEASYRPLVVEGQRAVARRGFLTLPKPHRLNLLVTLVGWRSSENLSQRPCCSARRSLAKRSSLDCPKQQWTKT